MGKFQKLKRIDLEQLVEENRFTISVVFPVVGAITLLGSATGYMPTYLSFNPYLILFGTLVMRLPLIAGLKPLINRRSAFGLILLTAYTYVIEFIGTATGFPYGSFKYGVSLGPMLLGEVPLALPIFFIPLVVNSYLLVLLVRAERSKSLFFRLPAALTLLLLFDIVLDPAAVSLGFWSYSSTGFYGVPLTNFAGWMLSGTISILLIHYFFDFKEVAGRLASCSFMLDDVVSFVFLWGAVNLYFANFVPFVVSIALIAALLSSGRYDHLMKI